MSLLQNDPILPFRFFKNQDDFWLKLKTSQKHLISD